MSTPIFIVTKSRTGSTLLQRLLNSYDDTIIWGEHAGVLKDIAKAYSQIQKSIGLNRFVFPERKAKPIRSSADLAELVNPSHWQAWMNWFGIEDVASMFRQLVLSLLRPSLVSQYCYWGFKEVRYAQDDGVIEFLAELFPEAKFIFLFRNSLNRSSSLVNAVYDLGLVGRIRRRLTRGPRFVKWCMQDRSDYRRMLGWHNSGKVQSYLVRYEDLIKGGAEVEQLLAALGKCFGPKQQEVLAMGEGRGSNFASDNTSLNERGQLVGWPWFPFARMLLRKLNDELGYETDSLVHNGPGPLVSTENRVVPS